MGEVVKEPEVMPMRTALGSKGGVRNISGLKRGGSPGRPRGVPNIATREVKEFWASFFDSPEYRENLQERMMAGEAQAVELYIWHLCHGKNR